MKSLYYQARTNFSFQTARKEPRMYFYNFVVTFLLLTATLAPSYGGDQCEYDKDCTKNGTQVCCHRRTEDSQPSVCRETCLDESCDISWDCGEKQDMFCCSNHICKSSSNMCPSDKDFPTWITVVVVLSVLCTVFGIGATMFCIYQRHRSRLSNRLLIAQ